MAVCFACGALSAPGQSYALGLYFDAFVTDLGLTRVAVSSVYGWATLTAAALLPLLGRLADRSSSGRYLGLVVAGLGGALFFMGTVGEVVGLAVGLFCLRLLGQGAIGLGTITAVLRLFDRHRGRAVATAALGYAFGEFTMPALITTLQARIGWRESLMALGGIYLACALLVAGLLRAPESSGSGGGATAEKPKSASVSAWIRRPVFWALVALATIVPTVLTGVALHQLALFRFAAWRAEDVVPSLRAYAIANLVATYGAGLLMDRIASKFGIAFSMTMLELAVTLPLVWPSLSVGPVVFWALLGAAAGSASGTHGVLWAEYFGVSSIGSLKGIVNATRNAATAAGAVVFVALAGSEGNYQLPLVAAATLAGLGLAGAVLLPRAHRVDLATHGALSAPTPAPPSPNQSTA